MKIKQIAAILCVMCLSLGAISAASAKEKGKAVVSAALDVIAADKPIAVSCVAENEVPFEADDFKKALNLNSMEYITIASLPPKSDGILYLSGCEVREGQTISAANLSYLKFKFLGENVSKSAFCFSTNHSEHEIECQLYSLKRANYSPLLNVGGAVSVSTYKNVSLYGKLDAYDPDGDKIFFEVIRQPLNGLVKVESDGTYVYSPTSGYVGNDSFKYVAVDVYGNYSGEGEIKLKVEGQRSSLVFSDISDGEYHVSAISLAEKGIVPISEVDGEYYFHPGAELGRLEYLVMAMKTLGIEMDASSDKTVFYDDGDIPNNLKGYVNTAVALGYVSGKIDQNGRLVFCPNDKITKAEAAVMLDNMCELPSPVLTPVFADKREIPSWAEDAVTRLAYNAIYPTSNGYVSAQEPLNRDEGAFMLYRLSKIANQ